MTQAVRYAGRGGRTRRFLAIMLTGLAVTAQGKAQKPAVAVVSVPDIEAYTQTLEGIREQLPDAPVWDARDEGRLRENLNRIRPALAIAVGSGAAAALERVEPAQLAVIATVVLECDLESGGGKPPRFKTAVTIDLPPEVLFGEIGRLFPGRKRVGVIRGPMQTEGYMRAVEQAARRIGLALEVMTCQHPRDLVDVFLKLKPRVDLVWCPPNAELYNSATLKPLLIASLTNRLPIIGFSEQFVQAGALFGGSADFVEVGRQTAALALQVVRNDPVPARQGARKFLFAYNQRVARLLGVKADISDRPGGDLLIIR
jgi:ABC-type uncharacterized transport system substrate-binding protein